MILVLATLVLYATALVQAMSIESETNAKRLAQGLAPLKPKRLFEPTRTGANLARRSLIPPVQGVVALAYGNGTLVCFFQVAGCNPIGDTTPVDATTFSAMVGYTGQQDVTSVSLLAGWNLAIEGSFTDPSPGSTDHGLVSILEADETPGTYPSNGGSEGGVWTLNSLDNNFMSATWTYSDNSHAALSFLRDPDSGTLYACPDCAAYNYWQYSDYGAFDGYLYVDIYLYFIPLSQF